MLSFEEILANFYVDEDQHKYTLEEDINKLKNFYLISRR